ncbi:MAG: RNA polymerase sigma factor [Nannocystales bacterium]
MQSAPKPGVAPALLLRTQAGLHELMERYADGDRRALEQLHRALSHRLWRFLFKFVHDEPACDDLVQLTLLKAHLARARFRVPRQDLKGSVQAWYFSIARNVAMDFLRDRHLSQRREAGGADNGNGSVGALPDLRPTALEHCEQVESEAVIAEEVRAAIEQLPSKQREALELHKFRGMSMADIASHLQVREGTVRVRAHRAYKTLARLLRPRKRALLGQDDAP